MPAPSRSVFDVPLPPGGLSLFERRLGRKLTEDEEEALYRRGKDDGGDALGPDLICPRCGEVLATELRHSCRNWNLGRPRQLDPQYPCARYEGVREIGRNEGR